jgi:transcription initiation factor IIE alpha subunit
MIYTEYVQKKAIKRIVFDDDYLLILRLLQEKVYSIDDLNIKMNIPKSKLLTILSELYDEGLVYYSANYNDITTIITL